MAVTFVMRITFFLLLAVAYGLAEGAPPMAKHSCPDRCGNVSIPYPFGIGSNCFMHKMYEIVCNESGVAAAAMAFLVLPSIRVEVLEINISDPYDNDPYNSYVGSSYEPGLIRVKMPIISSNCKNKSSVAGSGGVLDISGTPFFFSSYRNNFVSVGCNNKATMAGLDSIVFGGCETDCNNQKLRGKCTGFDCCQTTVPSDGIQRLNVTLESTTNNMNTCKHAFVAETRWLESNETDPSNDVQYLEYVPVALEWTIPNSTSIINLTEAHRRNMSVDYTSYGAAFYFCRGGYKGNPYLNTGCQVAYGLAEGAPPMAKHSCPDRCGNVSIPYPFGIGSNCFMHKMYEIVCNESGVAAAAMAFLVLPSIRVEVLEINISDPYDNDPYNSYVGSSYEPGLIRVKMPIISSNCKNKSSVAGSGGVLDISGTPFFFSSYRNNFVSVGCNNKATMAGLDSIVFGGCETDCNNQKLRGKCTGFDCCQTTVPSDGIQRLNVTLESTTNNMNTCKHAFVAETRWLESNETDPSNDVQYLEYVPVALEWTIPNSTSIINLTEAHRRNMSVDYTSYGAAFYFCRGGYKGNPYLNTGCQGINQCEVNRCPNNLHYCENMEGGGYSCTMGKMRKSPSKIPIIVISSSFGVLFLLLVIWWLYKVIKKRNKVKLKQKFFKRNGGLLLQQQLSSNENNVQKAKLFNSKELENATDRFNENRILGKGGQGTVYKGMLIDGRIVAIKKCNTVDEGNLEQFINEIIILSQINHRNVVKLLGCCLETEVPLLVYEFIPNGTLFQYLHKENEDFPLLTWDMRLRIATEIAGALSYLHSAASLPIYHRDIKSSNILLDDKYKAKIADFGTSRSVAIDQTHVTTLVYGTFGYLDPEYFQTSQFTEKSDVYSFGVVLIELLTGEKPVSSTRSAESRNISTYFVHSLKENRLFDILDTQVRKVCNKDEVMAIANLAKRCLHLNGKKRPTMIEIMMELEGVQKVSHVQPNFDELKYVRNEEMGAWNDVSISTSSCLELGSASSSNVLPLLSFKSV